MTKIKMYKYLGRNGILTTRIQLDGINFIPMTELIAADGKMLTNGERVVKSVIIEDEEISLWREIDDITAKAN